MASQARGQLPLFYTELEPLSSNTHANYKTASASTAPFLATAHAVPITVDEFIQAQRYFPIVFSIGDNPVPLALMGLNEGVNVFVDANGVLLAETYIPAYIRRHPFMLARLRPDSDELSLCFDPTSPVVGDLPEGQPLFADGKPTETTNNILKFCEEFELSAQRTTAFMKEVKNAELLIDGEITIQPTGAPQPFVYRGFQMVAEEKLRDLRGDELRKMNQNGMLALLFAHMFSLGLARDIFSKQLMQNKGPSVPGVTVAPEPAEA
jgi:SapC